MNDAAVDQPAIWVLDDEAAYCEARVRYFQGRHIPARGFTSGEAFLAALGPHSRGVASIDIALEHGGGKLNGIQVFERMLALGCHMPVVFLTAPFGDHQRLCVDMVTRRPHVDYFSKLRVGDRPILDQKLLDYLAQEPALYAQACLERQALHTIAIDMPHGEREALDGALKSKTAKAWADEIGIKYRTVQQQLAAGQRRYTGKEKLSGANHETVELTWEIAPLMARLNCNSLQQLAGFELARRLRLLDEAQQQVLHGALKLKRDSIAVVGVASALQLMGLDDFTKFRELLKNGGQNLQGWMLPLLSGVEHRWVRHWLTWVGPQPGQTPWDQLPDPPTA